MAAGNRRAAGILGELVESQWRSDLQHTPARNHPRRQPHLFTRSKDNRYVYAISTVWPGSNFVLQSVRPAQGSAVFMLGVKQPLQWQQRGQSLVIEIPQQVTENKPCKQAWVFKMEAESA